MYEPHEDNSEFIELYNNCKKTVDIGGWRLIDSGGNSLPLSRSTRNIPPEGYYLVGTDSSIFNCYPWLTANDSVSIQKKSTFSLSNSGESICLIDLLGNKIDSVKYSPDWHNRFINESRNRSLERINPAIKSNDEENWSTSVDPFGSTPCRPNSILTLIIPSESKLSILPNPFSPDNDGHEDFAIIEYSLTKNISLVRIRIYDSIGRLVRVLVDNNPSGSSSRIVFDGRDDAGRPLRLGIYILLLESLNTSNGITETLKVPIVIARKL
jgi:hypothetical protein